jgi:hypothetical protein
MNKHDRHNVNFLLSLTEKEMYQWYEQASDDDLLYAAEIMTESLLEEFDKYATNKVIDTQKLDTTEASTYLKKFSLHSH